MVSYDSQQDTKLLSLTDALQHRIVPAHLLVQIGLEGLHANFACLLDLQCKRVVRTTGAALVGAQVNAHLETSDIVGRPDGYFVNVLKA